MSSSRSRCAWAARSAFCALLVLPAIPAAALECAARLTDVLGAQMLAEMKNRVSAHAGGAYDTAGLGPTPDEVASTALENIPNMVRGLWLSPVRPFRPVFADAYAGPDYASGSPDVFVLPGGARALCHMAPGIVVFLSDGATFHYAMIGDVDHAAGIVTLADPWADVSFLRKGFNQAGVAGEVARDAMGRAVLKLSFADFATVFKGMVDSSAGQAGFEPRITFETLARIYPEIAETEAFLFWRYSRMLSRLDLTFGMDALAELANRSDLASKPTLGQLVDMASVLLTIRTNLGIAANVRTMSWLPLEEEPDSTERQQILRQIEQEIIGLLPDLAEAMPSLVVFRLLEDAAELDDLEFRLALIDTLHAKHPGDMDVALAKVRLLLMLGRTDAAQSLLAAAEAQWLDTVERVVAVPQDQALAWFEENSPKLGLVTFNLLHRWRAQIKLLEAIAAPDRLSVTGTAHWLAALDAAYASSGSYGVAYDYLSDTLWLAHARNEPELERDLIATGLENGRDDEAWLQHMAAAVLEHATWRRPMRALLADQWEAVRESPLKTHLCDRLAAGHTFVRSTDPAYLARRSELVAFCG